MDQTQTVVFSWKYGGQSVHIAGDFTDWARVPMLSRDFVWQVEIPLSYGHHRFKFVVDGAWRCDNSLPVEADAEGNLNNVILVAPKSPMRKLRLK